MHDSILIVGLVAALVLFLASMIIAWLNHRAYKRIESRLLRTTRMEIDTRRQLRAIRWAMKGMEELNG